MPKDILKYWQTIWLPFPRILAKDSYSTKIMIQSTLPKSPKRVSEEDKKTMTWPSIWICWITWTPLRYFRDERRATQPLRQKAAEDWRMSLKNDKTSPQKCLQLRSPSVSRRNEPSSKIKVDIQYVSTRTLSIEKIKDLNLTTERYADCHIVSF